MVPIYLYPENFVNMIALFQGCTVLKYLSHGNKFDTSKVTDMFYIFDNTISLRTIPLINFNTESATNMAGNLKDCTSVEYLSTVTFVTDNVEDMA